MYQIYGLVDPRNQRVFHVGYTEDSAPQLDGLPEAVARRISEFPPNSPQVVVLQTVSARPEVCRVKWSKRFRRDLVTSDWERQKGIARVFTNSKRVRRALGEEVSSDASVHAAFHAFDRRRPEVFQEMLERARFLRDEGRQTIGVDLLTCELRFGSAGSSSIEDFKMPNALQPFYSRKLQMIDPSLCGLFVMSPSVADCLVLEDGRTWRDFSREHSEAIRLEGCDIEGDAQ